MKYLLWLWHPAEGFLVVLASVYGFHVPAILFFVGFLVYELQEYREDPDTCALDIRDFLIGLGAGLAIALIARIICRGVAC